ncbi:MAG: hypothetical protein H0U44_09885, partial [Flavisolibacter sp.]|nr:hypothetical protein [Flavisolibacter sp.]
MKSLLRSAFGTPDSFVYSVQKNISCILLACLFTGLLLPLTGYSQNLPISDFVMFAGNGTVPGATSSVPPAPGYGVLISSSTSIPAGSIGGYVLVKTTGTTTTGSIHSGRVVELSNNATVNGRIAIGNASNLPASVNVLTAGSGLIVSGNIDSRGSVNIPSGSSVAGTKTILPGFNYSGPGTAIFATPDVPTLPSLPTPVVFANFTNNNITGNFLAQPGVSYGDVILTGNRTITFNGPGVYTFKSISNTGNANSFKFNFLNTASGAIYIHVHENAILGKFNASFINGGSATRVFMEVHGNATNAVFISNGNGGGGSRWQGTIYAPYGAIYMGSGTGSTTITGAMWSGTQVDLQSGVSVVYEPFCTLPNAAAGNDKSINCIQSTVVLDGSSSSAGASFSWTASNGGVIQSGATTATPTVSAAGTYTLTVSAGGCSASDVVLVTSNTSVPNAAAGADQTITCNTATATLTGTSTTPGATFNWVASNGGTITSLANQAIITTNAAGTYTLTVTNPLNGCTNVDQAIVSTNNTAPNISAGLDNALTCSILEITLNGSSSTPGATYSWSTSGTGNIESGALTASPVINGLGTYTLTVTHPANGCTATDIAEIFEGPCIIPYYQPCPNGKEYAKLGCELSSLYQNYLSVGTDTIQQIFVVQEDTVWIEIISVEGETQNLFNLIYETPGYGMTDTIPNGLNPLVITGRFAIANLYNLLNAGIIEKIVYVRPVYPSITSSGVAVTQGDIAQTSDLAREGFGVDGTGVKVCVLSDSYNTVLGNNAATDVVNGDLPGIGNPNDHLVPVDVIKDYPYSIKTDEGRAMLQIIHDVAPGAELGFRTGVISEGDLAQGVVELAQNGCDIIADDITFITSPFYQDGVIAKAVDSVSAAGVSYFVAAGNFASKSYENTFNPMVAPLGILGAAHDFGGGDNLLSVSLPPGGYTVVLQWQDSIYSLGQTSTGTVNDFDIYLTNGYGTQYFGFNRDNLGGDPLEVLPFVVPGTAPVLANLTIIRAAGTQAADFKLIFFRGEVQFMEYASGASTIVGQANAEEAITLGAVNYYNTPPFGVDPPTVQNFSSRGGTTVNGVVRSKPDLIAPNGGNTTVFMNGPNYEGDLFPNFFGTSAAT